MAQQNYYVASSSFKRPPPHERGAVLDYHRPSASPPPPPIRATASPYYSNLHQASNGELLSPARSLSSPQCYSSSFQQKQQRQQQQPSYHHIHHRPELQQNVVPAAAYNTNNNVAYSSDGTRNDNRQTLRNRRGSTTMMMRPEEKVDCLTSVEAMHDVDNALRIDSIFTSSAIAATKTTTISTRITRLITLLILCSITVYISLDGIEFSVYITRRVIRYCTFGITTAQDEEQSTTDQEEEDESQTRMQQRQQYITRLILEQQQQQQQQLNDDPILDYSNNNNNNNDGLRGSYNNNNDEEEKDNASTTATATAALSIHELNAKSHLLKSQGRQIITTTQDEIVANLDYNLDEFTHNNGNKNNIQRSINDNNDNNNKIAISYMDNIDTTSDYYYSGSINDKKRLINGHTGHIEIMTYPAYTHASLPIALLEKNDSFAISIWIHLLPIDDWETSSTTTTTINNDGVGGRRPRVILSTSNGSNSNDNRNEEVAEEGEGGCRSNILGESLVTGLVLYVQPHYNDARDTDAEDDDNEIAYRVILEYNNRVSSTSSSSSCHALVGTHQLLIKEGHWHHIALFVSSTRPSSEVDEDDKGRISLYVDGYLAGRNENTSLPRYHLQQQQYKLIVGRHAPPIVDSASYSSSSYAYYLDGRVGMLSFWETSTSIDSVSSSSTTTNTKSITTTRMQIKSKIDEDHVVRAVNRCAFDIRAITELSLQGLGVKEPTLLYTFDRQKKRDNVVVAITDLLYSESSGRRVAVVTVKEFISGRMDGEIISEQVDHDGGGGMATTVHERQPFVPLGGNRYAEYKDGTYIPRLLKTSERHELNEIAHARSILVKKAMQHAWNGYTKFAYGKDELLPLSQEGQDNWGGMATTLIDSLRQVKKCAFFLRVSPNLSSNICVLAHCG